MERIRTIRSGGQTGVDRAALDAARVLGIPITGWVPSHGWAEDMAEGESLLDLYPELTAVTGTGDGVWMRTEKNVRESDATLIILPKGDAKSFGTDFTSSLADRYDKPFHIACLEDEHEILSTKTWLSSLPDGIDFNIAGPRESECIGGYDAAKEFLLSLLKDEFRHAEDVPSWLAHSYGVAEKMYRMTKESGWSDAYAENMWLLGLLHDIGKNFGPHEGHESRGASILSRNGLDMFAGFIARHGNVPSSDSIPWPLEYLLRCDLSVDQKGEDIGFDARLKDIGKRHGAGSDAFETSAGIIRYLGELDKKREEILEENRNIYGGEESGKDISD